MIISRRIDQMAQDLFAGPLAVRALVGRLLSNGEQRGARRLKGVREFGGHFHGGHAESIAARFGEIRRVTVRPQASAE
jgi:hypothetical protein